MVTSHSLGFPRIGPKRELKFALEAYWNGKSSEAELVANTNLISGKNWEVQRDSGVDYVPIGDFSLYDHVLDVSLMLGNVPERFKTTDSRIDTLFLMGRGRSVSGTPAAAGEMTKWFNTNYHYIVPELNKQRTLKPNAQLLIDQIDTARKSGIEKFMPVITGPLTYLWMSKIETGDNLRKLDFVSDIAEAYKTLIAQIEAANIDWLRLDEPALVLDLDDEWRSALTEIYSIIGRGRSKRMVATYFESSDHVLPELMKLPIDGIHIDAVAAPQQLPQFTQSVKDTDMVLSVGIIDGRNVWKTNLEDALARLTDTHRILGDRMWISHSCSLMFVPVDLNIEMKLDDTIKSWLAFATQKLDELAMLKEALNSTGGASIAKLSAYSEPVKARKVSGLIHNDIVAQNVADITDNMMRRGKPYGERSQQQAAAFDLPLYPTTTVGSFPQTPEIRKTRLDYKRGNISEEQYSQLIKSQIKHAVDHQEQYGLDVFVHGEAERNDMVEYFGEQLHGYVSTQFGWVQSYGSRCVKPPIVYGDIRRIKPMTVKWITYAQTLTDKPVKGMLTGPVTMLAWAFRRDDVPFKTMCQQIALALRQEILDLEDAGISIIQLDEPAFREAMPLRAKKRDEYLDVAINCFKLAVSGVKDETQIQSHMCYSDFNQAMEHIVAMDIDVLLIEASRSNMKILNAFKDFNYPSGIGIGVFDIHSPNIQSMEQMTALLKDASKRIDKKQLWVTPDCGLKTRTWEQVNKSLNNMVASAAAVRVDGTAKT